MGAPSAHFVYVLGFLTISPRVQALLVMWQAALSVVYAQSVESRLPQVVALVNGSQILLTIAAASVLIAVDNAARALMVVEAIFVVVHLILIAFMVTYARRLAALGTIMGGSRDRGRGQSEGWHSNPVAEELAGTAAAIDVQSGPNRGPGTGSISSTSSVLMSAQAREARALASRALRLFFVLAVICIMTLTAGAATLAADVVHVAITDAPIGASTGTESFKVGRLRVEVLGSLFNIAECIPAFSILILFFKLSQSRHRAGQRSKARRPRRRDSDRPAEPAAMNRNASAAMFWGSEGLVEDEESGREGRPTHYSGTRIEDDREGASSSSYASSSRLYSHGESRSSFSFAWSTHMTSRERQPSNVFGWSPPSSGQSSSVRSTEMSTMSD